VKCGRPHKHLEASSLNTDVELDKDYSGESIALCRPGNYQKCCALQRLRLGPFQAIYDKKLSYR